MKILIAPNSFKNSASATEVSQFLREGILEIIPDADIETLPLADGGQGTVETLTTVTGGRIIHTKVYDPLMREIASFFGVTGNSETAVIEMAAASGIELLNETELDPMRASTMGTGQLIRAALDEGCKKIILGIGGSATNDGGMGMACALGVRFLDKKHHDVPQGGGTLDRIEFIDISGIDPRLSSTEISVACDVSNPLTGPDGASEVYGPQKGADKEAVKKLDKNLAHFASKIRKQLNIDIETVPGAGAAGGLGAGLMAFCGAVLGNGFDIISGLTLLEAKIKSSDLVITGEGKIDAQTLFGKTVAGVATAAKKHGKPVVAVAGIITPDAEAMYGEGIDFMLCILKGPVSLGEAVRSSSSLLRTAGKDIARMIKTIEKL